MRNKSILLALLTAGCAVGPTDEATPESTSEAASTFAATPNFAFTALQFVGAGAAVVAEPVTTAIDNLTLEAWIAPSDVATGQIVLYNGNSSSSGYGLFVRPGGALSVLVGGAGWIDCSCAVQAGRWTHVAAVRDATKWSFYINGHSQQAPANTVGDPSMPTDQFAVGAAAMTGADTSPFRGGIDEVRIWSSARTADEIKANYTAALFGNEPQLAGYYRLDDGGGTTAIDASPYHRTLHLSGNPAWIASGATLSTGIARNALTFTGAAFGRTNAAVATGDVTIETWARWDGGTGAQALAYNGSTTSTSTGPSSGYGLYQNNGAVFVKVGDSASVSCTSCALSLGKWTHLAAVYHAGVWSIYQDGVAQSATPSAVAPSPPVGALTIAGNSLGSETFHGALDEVRVWTTALSPADVASTAVVALPGNQPGLAAYYRLDEGTGTTTTDATGTMPMQLIGAAPWIISGAPLATSAR